MQCDLSTYHMCIVTLYSTVAGFRVLHVCHINYPVLVENACLSVCLHFICLPSCGSYPSPYPLCHPASVKFSVQNSLRSLFIWSNSPTAVYCHSM